MLTGTRKAAPGPRTVELGGPSGGVPAGGGLLEFASCGEGFWGSSGKSSSAMIYGSIIGAFKADLGRAGSAEKCAKGAKIQGLRYASVCATGERAGLWLHGGRTRSRCVG